MLETCTTDQAVELGDSETMVDACGSRFGQGHSRMSKDMESMSNVTLSTDSTDYGSNIYSVVHAPLSHVKH